MKIAVYTVVYGCKDYIPKFLCPLPEYDCFVVTDQRDLADYAIKSGSHFKPIIMPAMSSNERKSSRYIKCRPDLIFSDYEASVYLDANLIVKINLLQCVPDILANTDYAVFKHPRGITSGYDDGQRCIRQRRADPSVIVKQLEYYKQCGYEDKYGIIPACGILVRRHNKKDVVDFGSAWWDQILEYSERDQISWPFLRWRMNLKHAWIGDPGVGNIPENLFKVITRDRHVPRIKQ